jgi:2-oxoglutarate ferredoxin oxidoreductase subunit gamma
MTQRIICSGFGGQGVMLMGQLLAYAGMMEGKFVSWLPSYGPEMRGGTANCSVIISDEPVGAPTVTRADVVLVMNKPSMEKFEDAVVAGGHLFVNSSLIEETESREDIDLHHLAATEIGIQAGTARAANIVMLGAYLEKCGAVSETSVMAGLKKAFGEKKAALLPMNQMAINLGRQSVK